jgi:acyl-CoA thioesterase FadM
VLLLLLDPSARRRRAAPRQPNMPALSAVPAVAASSSHQVMYMDRMRQNLSTAIFAWCDASSFDAFPPELRFWQPNSDVTWVMAANTLEIVDRSPLDRVDDGGATDGGGGGEDAAGMLVTVESRLTRVGRSSWTTTFLVTTCTSAPEAPPQPTIIARVQTVNVCVRRGSLEPLPVPNIDALRRLASLQAADAKDWAPRLSCHTPSPSDCRRALTHLTLPAFTWRTRVRATDCDSLGHLNNTRYAIVAEEALGVAQHRGAWEGRVAALACLPARTVHIEYLEQLLPYEEMCARVWWDEGRSSFIVAVENSASVLASIVVLGVGAPALGRPDSSSSSIDNDGTAMLAGCKL